MPPKARDYYEVLGVTKSSSDKEIRTAYRKLARQHHPDLNPGDKKAEARFKELQQAYEVLSDAEKRKKYDQFGPAWETFGQAPPGSPGGARPGRTTYTASDIPFDLGDLGDFGRTTTTGSGGVDEGIDLGDILGRVFGGLGGRPTSTQTRPRRGRDIEQPVSINLEEAYEGTIRLIETMSDTGEPRRLEVKVPAGVRDGSRVRVSGEGAPGVGGGPRGDLYLVVSVKSHQVIDRKGDDLYTDIPVPLYTAILGGEVTVPTLKGKVALKIAPETQNGTVIRLGGKGMPRLGGGGFGDLFARVKVGLPTHLNPHEKELFEELKRARAAG